MNKNLFKALCFSILAVASVVAIILNVSVISIGLTVAFATVWVVLAIVFFVKFKREKE